MESIKSISISFLDVEAKDIPTFFNELKSVNNKVNLNYINSKANLKKDLYSKFKFMIHFDIMDNKFVPNTGVNIEYIKTAKNLGLYIDTHLMVENPIGERYIEKAITYGTDEITIHYEINNFESVLNYLNEKKEELKKVNRDLVIGVALKPNTDITDVIKYKDKFQKILLMSVEPGYGGQEYIENTNNKLKKLRNLLPQHIIQIDGGVNFDTIREPLLLGNDSFVIGSYITKSKIGLYNNVLAFNVLAMLEELPKDSNIEFDKKLLQIVKGGYGEGDFLIGISVPNIRRLADSIYSELSTDILQKFISSKYHEYRKFACFCLSNNIKKENESSKNIDNMKVYISFLKKNIMYINNWDLTDEIGPNALGVYLLNLNDKEALTELDSFYLNSNNLWIKRIGVVCGLWYARRGYRDIPFHICDKAVYDSQDLINKATGWVLRELYKKYPKEVFDYLKEKNKDKKLPRFVLSYACEKMSNEEKDKLKNS